MLLLTRRPEAISSSVSIDGRSGTGGTSATEPCAGSTTKPCSRPREPVPIDVDVEIALAAIALGARGFHRDPADRFIYATALLRRAPLVTKDAAIHTFAAHDSAVTALW